MSVVRDSAAASGEHSCKWSHGKPCRCGAADLDLQWLSFSAVYDSHRHRISRSDSIRGTPSHTLAPLGTRFHELLLARVTAGARAMLRRKKESSTAERSP